MEFKLHLYYYKCILSWRGLMSTFSLTRIGISQLLVYFHSWANIETHILISQYLLMDSQFKHKYTTSRSQKPILQKMHYTV